MLCDRANVIQVRKKDGSRSTVRRCADPQSSFFTQNVVEDDCRQCPRYLAAEAVRAAQAEAEATGEVPQVPSLPRRAFTWAKAVADWKVKGSPERSDEEVQRIFRTFCAATPPCSWYDPARQLCRGCGCGVAEDGLAVFNKIKMATQHCPRNLW